MNIIQSVQEMQIVSQNLNKDQLSIGFVPTMGYLHEGHMSLLSKARQENDIVVLSIFVNPLQFGPGEDLESYPRDFNRDKAMAKQYGVDYIFFPSVEEMYPSEPTVTVKVNTRVNVLCGKSRPGHFDGVATVLTKLFHIVAPTRAYFGLKDAQQVAVVEGLIVDFHFPVQLVPLETVREEDGLAKSSRNVRLTAEERSEAAILFQSLQRAIHLIHNGQVQKETIIEEMREMIRNNSSGEVDYIEIYSYPHLMQIEQLSGKVIIALAVKFSSARLIDNLIITV